MAEEVVTEKDASLLGVVCYFVSSVTKTGRTIANKRFLSRSNATRGFQTIKTATATIKGLEIMRMIRRGHCLTCKPGVLNEIRFVNQLFQVAA